MEFRNEDIKICHHKIDFDEENKRNGKIFFKKITLLFCIVIADRKSEKPATAFL